MMFHIGQRVVCVFDFRTIANPAELAVLSLPVVEASRCSGRWASGR